MPDTPRVCPQKVLLAPLAPAQVQARPGTSHWPCKCLGVGSGLGPHTGKAPPALCPTHHQRDVSCSQQQDLHWLHFLALESLLSLPPRSPDPAALSVRLSTAASRSQYPYLSSHSVTITFRLALSGAWPPSQDPQLPPPVPSSTSAPVCRRLCVEPWCYTEGPSQHHLPVPPHVQGDPRQPRPPWNS